MLLFVPALLFPALAFAAPTRLSVRSESGKLVRNDSKRGNQVSPTLSLLSLLDEQADTPSSSSL